MRTSHRRLFAAVSVIGLLALTACAVGPAGSPAPTTAVAGAWEDAVASPPDGRVIGVGMVIDAAGSAELCLAAIMESYPPQCDGIPVDDWSWQDVQGYETEGGTRWGSYAVYGRYDGERIAITDPPIMLALYDPIAAEDPTGGIDGTTSAADLTRIQDELAEQRAPSLLSVGAEKGYVWVSVPWDDGTLQSAFDSAYGAGVVIVTSALREVD